MMVTFAYVALFSWPLVAIWAFKKWPPDAATLVTIVGGYMLLPTRTSVDLPLLPALGKLTIPALMALFLTLSVQKALDKDSRFLPGDFLPKTLLIILIVGAFMTVLQNSEPLFFGPRFIPGMRLYDAFSFVLSTIMLLLPFFLAHKLLAQPQSQWRLLKFLVIAGLCYSALALFEVRFSPQLHRMFYGEHPSQFAQAIRQGGFRPTIFIGHGLTVSVFFLTCFLSALGLWKFGDRKERIFYLFSAIWLFFILILCKSLGALVIGILAGSLLLVGTPRLIILSSAIIASMVLTFPALRSLDFVPTDRLVDMAENIDSKRARSLAFRFANEDNLLAKANEKPMFGWGGYGRSRIYDPQNGRDISVIDGAWVLHFGFGGWTRYLALFGLICLPLVVVSFRQRTLNIGPETAVISIMLAANLIDLIPNSALTPVTFLMAGALWGRLALKTTSTTFESDTSADQGADRALRYSRYPQS